MILQFSFEAKKDLGESTGLGLGQRSFKILAFCRLQLTRASPPSFLFIMSLAYISACGLSLRIEDVSNTNT